MIRDIWTLFATEKEKEERKKILEKEKLEKKIKSIMKD